MNKFKLLIVYPLGVDYVCLYAMITFMALPNEISGGDRAN